MNGTTIPPTGVDPDLLIDDMPYEQARQYVLQFLISEKKTRTQLLEKEQAMHTWNERVAFAEKKGLTQPLEDAKHHLHLLIQERDALKAELDALHRKNVILKEKLEYKAKTAGVPSNAFAEKLLDDLGQLADVDEYKLNQAMKQQEAEDDLAKLKAKMGLV
jgi:hypothetical protein